MPKRNRVALAAVLVAQLASVSAAASGLDRDTVLVDAPALPKAGTVRVSGSASGALGGPADPDQPDSAGLYGSLLGTVAWTPVEFLSGDVGGYVESGAAGEAARLRLHILSQSTSGVELSVGTRLKSVGFFPERGEAELFCAVGRRFGDFSLVANAVLGTELGGDFGQDAELKGFVHYDVVDTVTVGLDARDKFEVQGDEPDSGRSYDFTAGPSVSWMITPNIELDGIVGVTQPLRTDITSPIALVSASFDF